MCTLPSKLQNDAIIESILEIQFNANVPDDAVYGLVYPTLNRHYPNTTTLPITNIPEEIRRTDPSLRYHAWYTFEKHPLRINLGPRSIAFINTKPYLGWNDWSTHINHVLGEIKEINLINSVERIGLRYINFFNEKILNKAHIKLQIAKKEIDNESTSVRTEFISGEYTIILQIGSNVNAFSGDSNLLGSIIDIDCIILKSMDSGEFFNKFSSLTEEAHKKGKQLFFELIGNELLESLNAAPGGEQ
ncbi:hypothetical protein Selin_0046 [Desulfurispirillum indicum S5]|uniref:TIGR04255 family protein n=2 Tax=Desulfurispirillum TaxID=393029 RepID=E6W4S7_DESIS|nr:hypothetical protein Selin_0046 [Desulfurispirillum indicum S5]